MYDNEEFSVLQPEIKRELVYGIKGSLMKIIKELQELKEVFDAMDLPFDKLESWESSFEESRKNFGQEDVLFNEFIEFLEQYNEFTQHASLLFVHYNQMLDQI